MRVVFVGKRALATAAAMIVAIALGAASVSRLHAGAVFFGQTRRSLPIYRVETEEKKVAISFDCAWGAERTGALLDEMKRQGVRCTFFAVEFWTEKYPETAKRIADEGHEIGTHSATHSYMSKQSAATIREELASSAAAIERVTGKKVELFRPPYGDHDDLLVETAREMGLFTVQWDVDSLDWKELSAEDIAMRVISRVKPGSIILCHNNGENTAAALPLILGDLIGKGYEFVPIGELIYRENFEIAPDGTQRKIRAA